MAINDELDYPVVRRPSFGTRLGQGIRTSVGALGTATKNIANQEIGNIEGAANLSLLPARTVGGTARDVVRGVTGAPNPNEGQPIGSPVTLPRLGQRPTPTSAGGGLPTPASALPTNWSPGSRMRGGVRRVAARPSPIDVQARTDFRLNPGDANTFTFSNGVTRPVAAASMPDATTPTLARPEPVTFQQIRMPGAGQGAVIPAVSEEQQRQSRQNDFLWNLGNTRFRSQRDALAQAYAVGEQGRDAQRRAETDATSNERIASGRNATAIAQANAEGQLAAQRINADTAMAAADRASRLEEARLVRRPTQPVVAADGTMGQIGDDGTWRPIAGPDGKPVLAPMAPRQTGDLTQADLLKSYDTRRAAISGGVYPNEEARLADLAALDADPLYAGLRGAGTAGQQAGMTLVGTKGGKNVYRDAQGNLHIDE